jgi:hypothetical protein
MGAMMKMNALLNAIIVGCLAAAAAIFVAHGRATPYDNYVLFADALLHGHLFIDFTYPGESIDAVLYNGHRYIVNDPVPGFLMLPAVAVFGIAANQTLLGCVMCGVACGAGWLLLERLGVTERSSAWLVMFLLAGTDLLWCSMLGDVWFVAQTCAVAFTLLALCELAGKRRGWLVAIFAALALGSRFTLVMALPVIGWWMWEGFANRERRPRSLAIFCATLLPFAIAWVAYNEARWHVPWDAGHTIFYHQDPYMGKLVGSPFALHNAIEELFSFLIVWPIAHPYPPYLQPLAYGTALWFTSPALVLAGFARTPRPLVIALWVATALVALPSIFYYANGGAQFGMRHALDFEPFLFALMALAARDGLATVWRVLIGWSVSVGLWGCWYWNTIVRPLY